MVVGKPLLFPSRLFPPVFDHRDRGGLKKFLFVAFHLCLPTFFRVFVVITSAFLRFYISFYLPFLFVCCCCYKTLFFHLLRFSLSLFVAHAGLSMFSHLILSTVSFCMFVLPNLCFSVFSDFLSVFHCACRPAHPRGTPLSFLLSFARAVVTGALLKLFKQHVLAQCKNRCLVLTYEYLLE